MPWILACLAVLTVDLAVTATGKAQDPAAAVAKDAKTTPPRRDDPAKGSDAPAKPLTLDKLKLPPGGILVLVEEARGVLQVFPKMVLLTPEKFQEMMQRISALERQIKAEKKLPHVCKLTGRLDGDVVRLQAEYKFTTERPRTAVFLGGQGAVITEAKLGSQPGSSDGPLPFLEPGDNGYSVQVEQAGEHVLTLQLQLPVIVRATPTAGGGAERGFELGLPGAAVTLLTLDLPPAVKELQWNEFTERQPSAEARLGHWTIPVGGVKNLNVSWKLPVSVPGAGALRTAEGQIVVQIQEGQILTTADLTLADLRGKAREWRVWVPPGAKLEVKTPPGLACEVVAPANPSAPHLLRLNEPTAERFHLVAKMEQARPLSRLPVGPFTVLDAYRQQGTITIKAAPEAMRGLKPVYHRQGEVVEQDVAKEASAADVIAVFKYWNMPPGTPGSARLPQGGLPGAAPLEVELQPVKGAVETQVEHTLVLKQVQEGWQVQAVTRIHAKPVHGGVDYLEVQLPRARPEGLAVIAAAPAGFPAVLPWGAMALAVQPHWPVRVPHDYDFEGEDAAATAELAQPTATRKAGIKLNHFHSKEFTVVLTGTYTLPPGAQAARLELPRPLGILDRGAKIKVEVESNLELLATENAGEVPVAHPQQQVTFWQRTPTYADMAWRSYRAEVAVRTIADVTLRAHHAHVRQELRFAPGDAESPGAVKRPPVLPPPLRLHVPEAVRGLIVSGGGKLQALDSDKQTAWIAMATDGTSQEPLVVEYDLPLPARGAEEPDRPAPASRLFKVLLLWPESATRAETRVRFWGHPGTVPTLAEPDGIASPWRDQGTEVVAGRDSLPALVVAGDGLDLSLKVRILEPALPTLPGVVLDRGLVQVTVDDEGTEYYRARFLVSKLSTQHVDVELPAPPAGLMLQIALDRKRLTWRLTEPGGKVVRLMVEPSLYTHPVVLDLAYRLAGGQPHGAWPWRNTLHPPMLHDAVLLGQVRWQVTFPARLVALVIAGDVHVEQHWAWHEWLPRPEPAATAAELEHWLGAGETSAAAPLPSVVCWRASLTPLAIVRLPRQVWFLTCSGLFLAVGLGMSFVPWRRFAFWLLAVLVALAVGTAAILWPSLVPALAYGCLPGVLVLVLLLGIQWLLHRQYRRQVVFMPGFTRLKPGSSLIRTGGATRPREASTIDAPPPPASSQASSAVKGN